MKVGQRVETKQGFGTVAGPVVNDIVSVRLDNGPMLAFRASHLIATSSSFSREKQTGRCEAHLDSGAQCKRPGRLIPGFGYACAAHAKSAE